MQFQSGKTENDPFLPQKYKKISSLEKIFRKRFGN